MSDQKITELTELTTPSTEDLLAIVDDPGGAPITKKITFGNLVEDAIAAYFTSGTWTPTFLFETPGTSSWTHVQQLGRWQKIGSRVFAEYYIEATLTKGTGSGRLYIDGLPYNVHSDVEGAYGSGQIEPFTLALDLGNLVPYCYPGTDQIAYYYTRRDATYGNYLQASNLADGTLYAYGNLFYEAA